MPPNASASSVSATLSNAPPLCAGDSPLSTTANVVSLLTFALGLFASYVALISATRGAPAEIKRLVDDLRATQREINRVAEYIFDDMDLSTVPGAAMKYANNDSKAHSKDKRNGYINGGGAMTSLATAATRSFLLGGLRDGSNSFANDVLYDEVQGLLKTCVTLFYEADDLLKRSERDPYGLRRRILFVMNRDEVTEKMNRLADQKAKLAAIQMNLFMRVVNIQIIRGTFINVRKAQLGRTMKLDEALHVTTAVDFFFRTWKWTITSCAIMTKKEK
ncbi:MAG: hypothetical protein Q9222_005045 [Ikaeria aurantiellina]